MSSNRYNFTCVPIEDSDHPKHMRSLIWVFDWRSVGSPSVQLFFRRKTKTRTRLGGSADWFQYSIYAYANLYFILDSSSCVNPFMPDGISHYYQLVRSITILRVVGWNFSSLFKSNRNFCWQTVETLIRRHVLWRLIWVCTVCLCPTKMTLGLYGLTSWSCLSTFLKCFTFFQRFFS